MFSLRDKIIAVTGGEGLLGKAICDRLAAAGAKTISIDVQSRNSGHELIIGDTTEEDSVARVISEIVQRYGRIDGWINNAYPRTADWGNKLEQVQFESWRKNVDLQLNGYFICSQLVLQQMKTQGNGALINMSSIYGVIAPDFSIYEGTSMTMPVAYSAIKGGVIGLTRYMAAYYGGHNVRVNAISPGGIWDNQPEPFVTNYNKKVPLKRMGTGGDIASAVHYLMTDEAAYVTGHNLVVDGGWSIV